MSTLARRRSAFWTVVFGILAVAGIYGVVLRFTQGLGSSTNLSDKFPWGLWIGFDVMCGVGLAAGGFMMVATVHIFNLKRYKPVLRPAILTAFLGYLLVIAALLLDLGRPERIWHALIMWNPHSVMFEVAWCVMLYTAVLALEFVPAVFEKLGGEAPLRWLRAITVPLVILGVILSTLHQASIGSLYLIVPHKLHPLWYTPLLPVMFFLSAGCVGLAMTIFESWHSSRAFGKQLEVSLLNGLGRALAVLLSVYLALRFTDLAQRHELARILEPGIEAYFFALETALLLLPAVFLFLPSIRRRPGALYACAFMAILGFVTNRLNVSVTGMEAGSGTHYIPKWTEVAVTLGIIAAGFAIFRLAVKRLPIFEPVET